MRSLHYAVVALGTPNVTFLVALDTGSDLFWVPCDCIKCAPLVSPNYGVRLLYSLLTVVLDNMLVAQDSRADSFL